MNHLVEADILATCNALGTEITGVYEKGVECLECLRDILRYLRKDDENHSVLRFLGSNRLVQTDLLPLLKHYEQDDEIFDFVLRLLVALTSPALLLFQEEIPEDKLSNNVYLQLISYLQTYKDAFSDVEVWKPLSKRLQNLLEMRAIERNENENLIIERILILIRNILHVPTDDKLLIKTDSDLSPHDKILLNLRKSKIDVSILYLCANEEEYQFSLHVLEIVTLMLREHSAETIALASEQRSAAEKEKDINSLVSALQKEQSIKVRKAQSIFSSRFCGVYSVKNMKSLSDRDYISHKLITSIDDVKFDVNKNAKRKPKNRLPAKDVDCTRYSTLTVRLFLKNFCKEFLKTYNKLMATVKRELLRKSSDDHDDSYYLWSIEYFMRFNRLYKFQPDFVSETISVQIFHHIQTQITNYLEMMMSDKKKAKHWSKRVQLGVSAYKELLKTLQAMTKSVDPNIQRNADIVISNIFYVIEYREMLLSLLSHFDEVKFPLTYLSELVESSYLFLKMLEDHSKRNSEIIIQKKKRNIRRRKKKTKPEERANIKSLDEQWADIASELSAAVQGRRNVPTDITPFDGASEMDFEEQKVQAVYKIKNALISKETNQAVGYLRAARELWPEGDSFGTPDVESEDEFLVLREIFLSDLNSPQIENMNPLVEGDSHEEETDEEIESMPSVTEQKLDVNEIYKRYATHKVVQPCCLLLENYQKNSRQTNSSLIKFLHRIAWDCKMHALFFQSTVFLTFQRIFQDPDVSHDPIIKEFYRFGKYIMRRFFSIVENNSKIFVEMLFWKGPREAYELEEGYGASESSALKAAWTEDEEEELKYLYEENKNIYIEGQDVADIILANLNKKRSKFQIVSALKRLGLIQNAKDLKPQLRQEWQETEIIDLQNLFEDHKSSDDIMGNILSGLSIKRPRKVVIEKLLELNLIQDRKEVLKKRSKSSKNKTSESGSESDNLYTDFEENNEQFLHENKSRKDESSDDEAENNFFKNLEAERIRDMAVLNHNEFDHLEINGNRAQEIVLTEKVTKKKSLLKHNKQNTSTIWDENEIMELHKIFNENRDKNDVLDIVLTSLSIKRSKKSIMEKILEMGLINDIKELKKKKSATKHNYQNSKLDIVWNESEIIELHQIFNENREKDDVLNIILTSLTIKRPKKNVIEKMCEIGLIKDIKELRKKKSAAKHDNQNSKLDMIWDESEIMELHKIFNENRDKDNILNIILNSLTVKRPKKSVIEKILEIGLIKDKKELMKTKPKPSVKNNKYISTFNGIIESDDEEAGKNNQLYANSNNLNVSRKKTKKMRHILSDDSEDELIGNMKATSSKENKTDGDKQKKKRLPKLWEEKEIGELQQLFEENRSAVDIIGNIMEKQTIKRPKQNIIEKLIELELIKDRKEVRKKRESKNMLAKKDSTLNRITVESSDEDIPLINSKLKNISKFSAFSENETGSLNNINNKKQTSKKGKEWNENEIIQLHQLFQENKDSADVLQAILPKMLVKRSKKSVKDKLLEMGLITSEKSTKERSRKNDKVSTQHDETKQNGISEVHKSKHKKKVLSESSEDETLPLAKMFSKHKQSEISAVYNETDSSSANNTHSLNDPVIYDPTFLPSSSSQLNSSLGNQDKSIFFENENDKSVEMTKFGKKRLRIGDSENSDNDSPNGKRFKNAVDMLDNDRQTLGFEITKAYDGDDTPIKQYSLKKRTCVLNETDDSE